MVQHLIKKAFSTHYPQTLSYKDMQKEWGWGVQTITKRWEIRE